MEALSIYAPYIAVTNVIAGVVGFVLMARLQPRRHRALWMIVGVPCAASLVLVGIALLLSIGKMAEVGVMMSIARRVVIGLMFAVLSFPGAWIGGALGGKMRPPPATNHRL